MAAAHTATHNQKPRAMHTSLFMLFLYFLQCRVPGPEMAPSTIKMIKVISPPCLEIQLPEILDSIKLIIITSHNTHTNACSPTYACTHTLTHTHTYSHTCMHALTLTHACSPQRMHAHTHTHARTLTHTLIHSTVICWKGKMNGMG